MRTHDSVRSDSVSPIYTSPVAMRFKERQIFGANRLTLMVDANLLPDSLSPATKTAAISEFKKFSNMRDNEEKLQRIEIKERLLKLGKLENRNEQDIARLTAMYLELGRRLDENEFVKEISEARRVKRELTAEPMSLDRTNSPRGPVLVPKLGKIPTYLIDGYYSGFGLLVTPSKIELFKRKNRYVRISRNRKCTRT